MATQWGYDAPDFVDLARAFKIPATSIDTCDCIEKGLSDLWRDPLSPLLAGSEDRQRHARCSQHDIRKHSRHDVSSTRLGCPV